MEIQEQEHKILTFKEVHQELEMENSLLLKDHNISDFSVKSDFLTKIGFTNSKATKMYKAIVESEDYRRELNLRYGGSYKFILTEQLERVCEKYNLYVRPLNVFAGDIPEKNIQDMMNFKFFLSDIVSFTSTTLSAYIGKFHNDKIIQSSSMSPHAASSLYMKNNRDLLTKEIISLCGYDTTRPLPITQLTEVLNKIELTIVNKLFNGSYSGGKWSEPLIIRARLEIAAIESLFLPAAFIKDKSRLGQNNNELSPTGQVDLDPIVMLKNNVGYIIITAWGDEANDELVVNQTHN